MTFVLDRRCPPPGEEPIDPGAWFETELPELLAAHGDLAEGAAARLSLPPLTWEVDGHRGGLHVEDRALAAGPSDDGLRVRLGREAFSDWVRELRTVRSLGMTGDLERHGGSNEHLEEWELVLHTLVHGTPVHEPGAVDLRDRGGEPLDLRRAFTPDDDPADIAHFLREAGYLHLRGWVDPADMAVVADDIDRALPRYTLGDGRSWWSTLDDGREACVRMLHFVEHSPTTARILAGPMWDRLRRAIADDEELVQAPVEGNCIEALVKPVGVATGISDVPWHRDCSLGGHPYRCGGTVVGISVTAGTGESGLLRAVAGSHRAATLCDPAWRGNDLPVVALPTETGDLTVHLTDTLHESLPPTARGRKVMYTGFGLPPLATDDDERNRAMTDLRNRAHVLTSQPANESRVP